MEENQSQEIPLIDITALVNECSTFEERKECAKEIDKACRSTGFFRIKGHGIPLTLQKKLDSLAREFFNMSEEYKQQFSMSKGGPWRGYFSNGSELTSGRPDRKEGIYLGRDLPDDHPRVIAKVPLNAKNLLPDQPPEFKSSILEWFEAVAALSRQLMRGIALGLGMPENWFDENLCKEPTELFCLFHYPPNDLSHLQPEQHPGWGVSEHTDYGILGILAQDSCGGLQVKTESSNHEWIHVPADEGVFIVNIGDMLDKLTEGRYRSTPHRVLNASGKQRISFPYFIDPSWDAEVIPLPLEGSKPADDKEKRWDGASVHAWTGKYGDYQTKKAKISFPQFFTGISI